MNAQEIINYIATAPKKTPVKAYVRVREGAELDLSYAEHVFGLGSREKVVFADWAKLGPVLAAAGAVVVEDVPAGAVVAGVPARVIKQAADVAEGKIALVDALRSL